MHNSRHKNKSTDNKYSDHQLSHYERKCITPSLLTHQNKKRTNKSKQNSNKSSSVDKKKGSSHMSNYLTKPHKVDTYASHMHSIQPPQKKQSPFKHKAKSRPISNLNNVRMAKNIDHQLSNLNESIWRESETGYHDESGKKLNQYREKEGLYNRHLEQAKKCMKSNAFERAIQIFKQVLLKDEENIQANYLLGVSYFHLQKYDECIKNLTNVLLREDHYRKNVYLFLGIAYKKEGLIDQSILTLSKALAFYPKYYDAIILRAKILSKQKRYYDAIQDLNKCIKLDPKNLQAYISKADCLRSLGQYSQAISLYTHILSSPGLASTATSISASQSMLSHSEQILLKMSIAEIESEQYQSAIRNLNIIIAQNSHNSEPYLFKGLAYTKMHNYNDAVLAYQQAIKYNTSKKATTKALYEIIKLKIELGDYYGAAYMVERANTLDVDFKVLQKVKTFIEGVTSIMKKKYRKGVQTLTILNRRQNLSDHIRPLTYSFRAYGYFSLFKFSSALADLRTLAKLGYKYDQTSEYNILVLQGILCAQNNQFEQSLAKFRKALDARSQLSDPLTYSCLTKVCEYNRAPKNKDFSILEVAIKYIMQSIDKEEANHNIHYICACILYELGDFEEALQNIEKAMNKSEEHIMKYLYLHAMIKGMMGQIKDAYKGFSTVITLYNQIKEREKCEKQNTFQDNYTNEQTEFDRENSKQIVQAYLNRAKCYLMFGEKKKAFQDLQTYIAKKPLDGEVHAVAGKLLFSIGAFEDAVKAYNYSPNIDKHRQTLEERLKCYLLLKQLNYCLKDMQKLAELGVPQIKYDYYCLQSLKEASKCTEESFLIALSTVEKAQQIGNNSNGLIFKESDMVFYKGMYKFYLKDYQEAVKLFSKSKNLKALNNQIEELQINEDGDADDDQFQNRIYTDKQVEYNIAITNLLLGKETAKNVLQKYSGFLSFFEGEEEQNIIDGTPFPTVNRLCSIFPQIEHQGRIKFRLSFCLPEVIPPEIKLKNDPKIIRELNMCSAQPRPDAPWIKRNIHGIIFTDEIIGMDIDLKTQKSQNNMDAIRIETQEQNLHSYERQETPSNIKNNLKQIFSMDSKKLEEKLEKIIKRH